MCLFFFFFKQKTAYEMRISDWSSDVCSSDLLDLGRPRVTSGGNGRKKLLAFRRPDIAPAARDFVLKIPKAPPRYKLFLRRCLPALIKIGRASCRERVCQYV